MIADSSRTVVGTPTQQMRIMRGTVIPCAVDMTGPEPDPEPTVDWDEFEQATDLLVTTRRDPDEGQPREPVKSR